MPEASVTKYCCKRYTGYPTVHYTDIDCGNTYTVQNLVVTSDTNFGVWTDGAILSRTCASITFCDDVTKDLETTITIGCIPSSLFPLNYKFDIYENGVFWRHVDNSVSNVQLTCPDGTCPEICS